MKPTQALIVILVAASLGLLGCGKSDSPNANAKGSIEKQATPDPGKPTEVAPTDKKPAEAALAEVEVVTEQDFEEEAEEISKDNLEKELKKIEDELKDGE